MNKDVTPFPMLALALLLGLAAPAYAGVANFSVTNDSDEIWYMKCSGPYSRIKGVVVEPGFQDKVFYSPGDPIFFTGPYGKWACGINSPEKCATNFDCEDGGCFCCQNAFGSPGVMQGKDACTSVVEFCLFKDPDPDIAFTVTADGTLTSNGTLPPCNESLLVTSTLGFEVQSSSTDEDFYEFDGQAGDQVTIRMDVDPDVGRKGERASLSMGMDPGTPLAGGTANDTVPIELQMTLPETGTYWVKLSNRGIPRDDAFVGGYTLNVNSQGDLIDEIRPRDEYNSWQELSGTWWSGPARDGEGAQVEVADAGNGELVFVTSIFSYAPEGGQVFLVGAGTPEGDSFELELFITSGGAWGEDFNPDQAPRSAWGTGVATSSGCNQLSVTLTPNTEYLDDGYTVFTLDLERLTTPLAPCSFE